MRFSFGEGGREDGALAVVNEERLGGSGMKLLS